MIMILKIFKKSVAAALLLSLCITQCQAMKKPSQGRSISPTQLQVYLPSDKMEPHRSISQKNLKSLQASITDPDEGDLRRDLRNSQGLSPLEHAIQDGFLDGIKMLMQKGASPAITNEASVNNGFHVAAAHGTPEIIQILMVHTPFPDIEQVLAQELKKIDVARVAAASSDQRRATLLPIAQKLTNKHLVQMRLLVTQYNNELKTPEMLAKTNKKIKAEQVDANELEKVYGQAIAERYLTELLVSLSETIAN